MLGFAFSGKRKGTSMKRLTPFDKRKNIFRYYKNATTFHSKISDERTHPQSSLQVSIDWLRCRLQRVGKSKRSRKERA